MDGSDDEGDDDADDANADAADDEDDDEDMPSSCDCVSRICLSNISISSATDRLLELGKVETAPVEVMAEEE